MSWVYHHFQMSNMDFSQVERSKPNQLTWMMLCMCGIKRSMRTSSNMTRARQTFFRTSESSSVARAKRLCARIGNWKKRRVDQWEAAKGDASSRFCCDVARRVRLTSMKVSMLSIRAWALLMMNWLTQAMAWDLQDRIQATIQSTGAGRIFFVKDPNTYGDNNVWQM